MSPVGVEPTAIRLKVECSTTELQALTGGVNQILAHPVNRLKRISANYRHFDDRIRVGDRTTLASALFKLLHSLHACSDLADDSVLPVQPAGGREADEKLAIGGVRVLRAGHAKGAGYKTRFIGKFGRHVGQRRATRAGARGDRPSAP